MSPQCPNVSTVTDIYDIFLRKHTKKYYGYSAESDVVGLLLLIERTASLLLF